MLFILFVLDYLKLNTDATLSVNYHGYTGSVYHLGKEKFLFYLVGEETQVFSIKDLNDGEDDTIKKFIHEIGESFNEILISGKYREHFTTIP
jgi:hypothetical protein